MESLQECMHEYKRQLEKGYIQKAYRGLMDYFSSLKIHLKKKYPVYLLSSNIYFGYMDMTYFSVIPEFLKQRKLKIAIVFVHDTFRFEVWLSGVNRDVQEEYWKKITKSGWNKYSITPDPRKDDCILSNILVSDPDFSDLDALTEKIETGVVDFIQDVEDHLG